MYFCGNYVYSNVSNWEDFNIFIVFDLFLPFSPQKCFFWPKPIAKSKSASNITPEYVFSEKSLEQIFTNEEELVLKGVYRGFPYVMTKRPNAFTPRSRGFGAEKSKISEILVPIPLA